ncbi:hypothetical protein P3L10_007679 [Capsicum annuum]
MSSIPNTSHTMLDNIPSLIEIRKAVFIFKATKAPGPDGIHPLFFQKFWDITSSHLVFFCNKVFSSGEMDTEVNTYYLCLIPKFQNVVTLKNIRPIDLCNTQYKIVSKIIANRIKPFLNKIIGPT